MKHLEYPVTALRICIDIFDTEKNILKGRICGVAVEEEKNFKGSTELLFFIDEILDRIGKPQSSRKIRSFKENGEKESASYNANPKHYHTSEEIRAARGSERTVDVYFMSRLKSSWQGFVQDEEGNKIGDFISDLEFLDLVLG